MHGRAPRIWPALVIGACATHVAGYAAWLLFSLATTAGGRSVADTPFGVTSTYVTVNLLSEAILLVALVWLANRASEGAPRRLGLGRGRLRIWLLFFVLLGVLAASAIGANVAGMLFDTPSRGGIFHTRVARSDASLPLILTTMALLPALTEELLFRGYVQTRLLRRLPAWAAVGLSSVCFAGAHVELQYMTAVLPIGLWLGFVALLAESVWPTVLAHGLYNGLVVAAQRSYSDAEVEEAQREAQGGGSLVGIAVALLVLLLFAKILRALRRPRDPHPVKPGPIRPV